ncbi:MAG: hypothetical protein H0X42_02335 [Solirubrobacterales bacterium]|nr:hypothetical protein [Solirubrobacterales bacterium]
MESMRATWTDSRLDDFAAHTDRRFDDLNGRVDRLAVRVEEGFREIREEIGALERTIIQVGGALLAALVVLLAAMLGLIVTQL